MRYVPASQLKDLLTTPETPLPDDVLLYKIDVLGAIEPVVDTRQVRFIISTGTVDRDRDVIQQQGWQLDHYRKNPVVLWAHDSRDLPIARTVELGLANDQLTATAEFAPADIHPFAETVYQLLLAGYLRATSVGFRPHELAFDAERGGYNFLRTELLEWSVVPVPANPQCLIDAKSQGVDLAPLKGWAERTLDALSDEPGLWLPKSQVERVFSTLSTKTISLPPAGSPSPTPSPSPADTAADVSPSTDAAPAPALPEPIKAALVVLDLTPAQIATAPWDTDPATWEEYVLVCRALHDLRDVDDLTGDDLALKIVAELNRETLAKQLFPDDAPAPEPAPAEPEPATDELIELDDDPAADDDELLDIDIDTLQPILAEAVSELVCSLTGRVPEARFH